MASINLLDANGRKGFRIRFYVDDRRREIYIPGTGAKVKRMAAIIAGHCDELTQAKANNVASSPDAQKWANGTDGKLRENLIAWGLAEPTAAKLASDDGRLLNAFSMSYIDSRTDVKPTTRTNYLQTRRLLVEYFKTNRVLKTITQADANRWRRWMTSEKNLAVATVSKHCKRAKTMLSEAVKDRLLSQNPFGELKGGNESNADRQFFVTTEMSSKVLSACPDHDWRLIFALSRWAGLRCPSEVLGLKWSDVLWDQTRLRIDSPKTGLRFCPIFPELLPILEQAFDEAADGAVHCVGRYRGQVNLGTQLHRIIQNAGITPWPKTFVNLRSTRRTELQESFPDHVVNRWLGHSGKVAEKHYLQVTDEHWNRAANFGSPTGSPISVISSPITNNHEKQKTLNSLGNEGLCELLKAYLVTPTGVEPVLPP